MNRTAALLAGTLAVTAAAATPSLAAPAKKKSITKTYTATAPRPDPTNSASDYSVCAQNVPESFHTEKFRVPAAGRLTIQLRDYQLDWDLLLMDAAKREIDGSGSGGNGQPENIIVKLKKAQDVFIVACNWAGGPTGTVQYTFRFD